MSEALLVVPRKSWENWRTSRLKSMDSKTTWGICDDVPLRGGTCMDDSHQVSVQYCSQNLIGWGNSIRRRCSFTCGFQASRGSTVRGSLLLDLVPMGLKWVVHTLCVLNRQQICQGSFLLNSDGGFAFNVLLVFFSLMYVYTVIWMVASGFTLLQTAYVSVCCWSAFTDKLIAQIKQIW